MTSPYGGYADVNGTIYHLIRRGRGWRWVRASVPPAAKPGKRCPVPVSYAEGGLPAHTLLDSAEASRRIAASLEAWKQRLRAQAPASVQGAAGGEAQA